MNAGHYPPPKRRGLIVHGTLFFVLTAVALTGFISLTRAEVGPAFLISLLIALISFIPLPFLAYRAYSLFRADYHLNAAFVACMEDILDVYEQSFDKSFPVIADDLTRP